MSVVYLNGQFMPAAEAKFLLWTEVFYLGMASMR